MRPAPKALGRAGTAMAEMLVATLLVAMAVSMVMGALLNAPTQGKRSEYSEKAHAGADLLLETLANYNRDPAVVDDPAVTGWVPPGTPAWHLPGDACTGLSPNCWALQECPGTTFCHSAPGLLPADFAGAPFGAAMTYRVWTETNNGQLLRNVDVSVNYQTP